MRTPFALAALCVSLAAAPHPTAAAAADRYLAMMLVEKRCVDASSWPLEGAEDMNRFSESHLRLVSKIPGSEHIVVQDTNHMSILRADVVSEQILKMVGGYRETRARE